ncbi:unnamed protein product, partial [Rotaria magnacalcarata]
SPLKSPMAIEQGAESLPVEYRLAFLNVPLPYPRNIPTLFPSELATAMSCALSLLKS